MSKGASQGFGGSRPRLQPDGFTLIELVVVISIIAVLAGTLLNRIWFYQEQAEKAAMEQVAGALQSALTIQFASLMARGREADMDTLATANPMNWLARKPANYAGEFYGLTPQSVPPGSWAFDLKSRNLVYVVERGEYFTPGKDGAKWVRYRVSPVYENFPEGNGGVRKALAGAVFGPAEPYHWLEGKT